jgi:aryl-alcohol dehydrogenase-like predicted oxidoreductase
MYGNVRSDGSKQTRDDKESLATINLAVEEGINFFDTATALLIP